MSDQKLKLKLTELFSNELELVHGEPAWRSTAARVRDTEWLHVCNEIETREFISIKQQDDYRNNLCELFYKSNPKHTQICSASWQQRANAILMTLEAWG